jgi:hypothetical protein
MEADPLSSSMAYRSGSCDCRKITPMLAATKQLPAAVETPNAEVQAQVAAWLVASIVKQ